MLNQLTLRLSNVEPQTLQFKSSLSFFFEALARYEANPNESTVRVLQFGDSHTAADMFTGEMRRMLQQKFGDGGIGFSYAGHPFAGYRIEGSGRTQSAGWTTQGNHFLHLGDGLTGLGGIGISTENAGEEVTLDAECSELQLQYLQQFGGGKLLFEDNGFPVGEISTDAFWDSPGTFTYACSPGEHHFGVVTEEGAPVRLLGWVTERPGVTWESIGINGAEAPLILKWDQTLFSHYLKDRRPALVVLAYGTNEAANSFWDEDNYSSSFAAVVDTIHSYVPQASVLVIGPSDRSLSLHHGWRPFSGTDRIIAAQREVCRLHNCAYWDQRERMGGFGSMQQWSYIGWAQPDHTHFTGAGYHVLADALTLDLMADFLAYKESANIAELNEEGAKNGSTGAYHKGTSTGKRQ